MSAKFVSKPSVIVMRHLDTRSLRLLGSGGGEGKRLADGKLVPHQRAGRVRKKRRGRMAEEVVPRVAVETAGAASAASASASAAASASATAAASSAARRSGARGIAMLTVGIFIGIVAARAAIGLEPQVARPVITPPIPTPIVVTAPAQPAIEPSAPVDDRTPSRRAPR